MSKKIKQANREKRLQEKRARKSANKARYAELTRLGINRKSKRAKANAKKKNKIPPLKHSMGFCGNIGCKKCYPEMHRLGIEYREKNAMKFNKNIL